MMDVRVVQVDPPEAGHLVLDASLAKQAESAVVQHLLLEGDLSAGEQANRDVWLAIGREAAGDRAGEIHRHEPIANFGRSGSDQMETVVTHCRSTPLREEPMGLFGW